MWSDNFFHLRKIECKNAENCAIDTDYSTNQVINSYCYVLQEAIENFVFPEEIETKLTKMSKFMNIFYVP